MNKPLIIRIDGLTMRQKEKIAESIENLLIDMSNDDKKLNFSYVIAEESCPHLHEKEIC